MKKVIVVTLNTDLDSLPSTKELYDIMRAQLNPRGIMVGVEIETEVVKKASAFDKYNEDVKNGRLVVLSPKEAQEISDRHPGVAGEFEMLTKWKGKD